MNDLISREKLIKDIDTVFFGFIVDDNSSTRNKLLEFINNHPTAYDVDEVVEQITDIMKDENIRFANQVVQRAVNIVKGAVKE